MTEREVRYCTTEDGVRIAYCVYGDGPPLFVLPNFVESFSLEHLFPEMQAFWGEVARHHTIIRLDLRGTGLSQRGCEHYGLDEFTSDLDAVVGATRFEHFALWASIVSSPHAIKYAAEHPTFLSHLLLFNPYVSPPYSPEALRAYATLWRTSPHVAAQALADQDLRSGHTKAGEQIGDMYKRSVDGEDAALMFTVAADGLYDATPYLSRVETPTLIMHRRGATTSRFDQGQQVAAGIRDSRFVPLDGASDLYPLEDPRAVIDAVLKFTQPPKSEAPNRAPDGALRTVLFTDLVGHTEMMSRLGDERGRAVLREHEDITRNVLKQHGGTEVKTMGDGFMASFGSVTKAVECAIALQRAFAERNAPAVGQGPSPDLQPEPLHVRVGLNAGEPIEEDGDLFGATVILASRIAAKADAGEILVADTVRGLCSGKGFLFADRGDFIAKGFEEPVRMYEVSWRG